MAYVTALTFTYFLRFFFVLSEISFYSNSKNIRFLVRNRKGNDLINNISNMWQQKMTKNVYKRWRKKKSMQKTLCRHENKSRLYACRAIVARENQKTIHMWMELERFKSVFS